MSEHEIDGAPEKEEWPPVIEVIERTTGPETAFGMWQPEGANDLSEYETQRYIPESREIELLDAINDAHEERAFAPGMECTCEHCERLAALQERSKA